VLYLKMFGENR